MMEIKAFVADPKHDVKKPQVYALTSLKIGFQIQYLLQKK